MHTQMASMILGLLALLGTTAHAMSVPTRRIVPLSTGLQAECLSCVPPGRKAASPPVLFVHGTFHGVRAHRPLTNPLAHPGPHARRARTRKRAARTS